MPTLTSAGVGRRLWDGFWAILRQRCPRCRQGRMFRGRLTMNDPCPVCGLVFQREEGYFLGAMYVSYVLSTAILGALYLAAITVLPTRDNLPVTLAMLLLYLPFMPAVFRYS